MRGAPLSCLKFRSIFSLGPKPISRSQRDAASWTRMAPLSLTWRTCLWTHSNIRPIRSQTRVWYQKHGQIPIFVPTEHILDPRILESMSIHTNTKHRFRGNTNKSLFFPHSVDGADKSYATEYDGPPLQDVSGQVAGRGGHARFSHIEIHRTLWQPQII
jgi:hypothetical protein